MSTPLARRFLYMVEQLCKGDKKAFAEMTGKSASHIYKICRGVSRPSLAYLQHLNDELKVDLNWLLTGERASENPSGMSPASQDLVFAPMFDVQASAGVGESVNSEDIEDYFAFNKNWLARSLGVSSDQLVFVSIRGDSMEPTLYDGDQVLVDLSKTAVNNNKVYLIHSEQGLMAKRLANSGGHDIQVMSDNPDYSTWHINTDNHENNRILGQIVWSARAMKF